MSSRDLAILLVEDNPDDAEVARRALRKAGMPGLLEWVKDGAEALDFMFGTGAYQGRAAAAPRVVLLDMRLPKVDGLEVLRALKGDPRTRAIPVVMMTSSTQDEDVARSYAEGANSFVSKPVQFEEFARQVGDLGRYWLHVNRPPPGPGRA